MSGIRTSYDVGDQVRLTATFTNSSGTATDPSGLIFEIRRPDGSRLKYVYGTDAELLRSAPGIYYVDFDIEQVGIHSYKFTATGTNKAAQEGQFVGERFLR